MTLAISAHHTIWSYQPTPGGAWVEIAELGDITPPELTRNEFESTTHNINIDAYVLGVMHRGAMTVPLNFLPTNGTHDHITGLYKHMINNTISGHKVEYPDGTIWVMSGQLKGLAPKAPVDGKLALDVTVRFSGLMQIGTAGAMVTIGA